MKDFMKNSSLYFSRSIFSFGTLLLLSSNALAFNPIIRPFDSVRAEGMGDVRYSTGLYEENFFANPARADTEFQIVKLTAEAGTATIGAISELTKSDASISDFADQVGKPISARVQLVVPGIYLKHFITDKWSLAVGLELSAQTAAEIGESGIIAPTTFMNVGPAVTLARRLLDEDRLSIGATLHTEYRASSNSIYSISDFLSGTDLSNLVKGGSGFGADFDLGTTFRPHWTLGGFEYELAFAMNNLAGGKYTNFGGKIAGWSGDPIVTPRSYNFGVSATQKHVPFFDSIKIALESTDIGNNADGSYFRTLHAGAEALYGIFAFRAGINQGYIAAGAGVDLGFFDVNFATYGEELGLNTGDMQDRRYALEVGIQI
jgi:hypothetical protein